MGGGILVEGNGVFCFGPRDKIDAILNVRRYAAQWPLIPVSELHASSVQHPDDLGMRWLLHTRRVKCMPSSDVAQLAAKDVLPKSAGIGDRDTHVWCCRLCVDALCKEHPKMPPLALANAFFGGRHHPLFRDATLASRMLASSARLIWRQLFLGRGPHDEVHQGMTGNTMLIAQPGPSYEQVMPNTSALTEGLVTLFCRSVDDVAKAQMLVVNREQYRQMVVLRKRVCPTFASSVIDQKAVDELPDAAVPAVLLESAQAMPEAADVRTTMHGPANRIPLFSRQEEQEDQDGGGDSSDEEQGDGADLHRAAATVANASNDKVASALGESVGEDSDPPAEPLNEHETIIGVDEDSVPKTLRLFEAWNASVERLNAEAAKFAQAELKQREGDDSASAIARQVGTKELVRTSIAVDMIDIAKQMSKSSKTLADLEMLAAA